MIPRLEEVREWLETAQRDLFSARILTRHRPPVLDTACFHCQQAVEKVLKAFLVWTGTPFERVHSLTYLLDLCEAQEPEFASLRDRTEALAPYAVEIRYPGGGIEVSLEEAEEALATAEAVWDFVLDFLPAASHPTP